MEENEDEPEDVRKATPVSGAIKSGSKDPEKPAGNRKATGNKTKDSAKPSRCDKNAKKPTPAKSEADCCRGRISGGSKTPKTMSVLVYSPPCTLPRLEIIPRHCLSKQEYIDVLSSPSRKCPPPCLGKTVVRRIRPISARVNELAQPARRLIVSTLQQRGDTLPPEMVENLVKSIEGSACMTPEQAERYFRDGERRKEKKAPKNGRQKCGGKLKAQCPSQLDKEAVMCQYLMAERFVKSIIGWKCPIPVEEFSDIASVILRRLSFVLEYEPSDGRDLKSQQMRFLADIIACWISGVLFEVAEEHKKEIQEEIQAQKEEEEEEEDEEDEEGGEEQPETPKRPAGEPEEDDEDDGGEKGKLTGVTEVTEVVQQKRVKIQTRETGTQTEDLAAADTKEPDGHPVKIKSEPMDGTELAAKDNARVEAEGRKNSKDKKDSTRSSEQEDKVRLEAERTKKRDMEEAAANEARLKAKQEEERWKKEAEEEEARKRREDEEMRKKKRREEEEEENAKRRKAEEEEEAKRRKEAEEEKEAKRRKEAEAEEEAKRRKEAEEEEEAKRRKEAEEKKRREEEEEAELKKKKKKKAELDAKIQEVGPKDAIAKIGDGELFRTDLPFVTFGKIVDTVYKMLEDEPEGDETDLVHNRIQRALYEKLSPVIELERPGALTENLKDVVDVLSGKAATWIKRLLDETELKFMQSHPPEVESREIRDWGKWIDQVTDRAGDWAEWIHRVVEEADDRRDKSGVIKRGDWQNWTRDTDTNALLWRRYYLETVHQAHHNKMMLVDRPVVKTGEKQVYSTIEEEIESTDLGNS